MIKKSRIRSDFKAGGLSSWANVGSLLRCSEWRRRDLSGT